jgi:hypothetical protein
MNSGVTGRTILATQFELLDGVKALRWNHIATLLNSAGIDLILLTSNVHSSLELPYVEIPYPLSGYADYPLYDSDLAPDLSAEVALETGWQSSANTANGKVGAEKCWLFYYQLLQELDPDLVLAWNTLLPQSRILRRICQQLFIPCQTLERGLLPGTWMMDPGDNHLENSLYQSHALASLMGSVQSEYPRLQSYRSWYQEKRPHKYESSGREQLETLRALKDTHDGLILVLAPVAGTGWMREEAPLERRSLPGFRSAEELLAALPEIFPDHLLAFRDHPINLSNEQAFVLPEGISPANDANLTDYLELADKALVLGGTTTLYEVMLHRKPFMVAGQCLSVRALGGLTASRLEDLQKLAHLQWQDCESLAEPLLEFMLDQYLIQIDEQPETGFKLDDWVRFLSGFPIRPLSGRRTGREALISWLQRLVEG